MPLDKDVDVKSLDNQGLLFNHLQVHNGFRKFQAEGSFPDFSKEDFFNLHKLIAEEMASRGINHNVRDDLDKVGIGKDEQQSIGEKMKLAGIEYEEV